MAFKGEKCGNLSNLEKSNSQSLSQRFPLMAPVTRTDVVMAVDDFFPFLKLPTELRREIYLYTFGGQHIEIQVTSHKISKRWGYRMLCLICSDNPEQWFWQSHAIIHTRGEQEQAQTAILRANRQISREASQAFYSATTFHFNTRLNYLADFLKATPDHHLACITRLNIMFPFHFEDRALIPLLQKTFADVIGKMRHLKFLDVVIWALLVETSGHYSAEIQVSEVLPCLKRGTVQLRGDTYGKTICDHSMISHKLCVEITDLIKGKHRDPGPTKSE